jgi:hypothetical protein
MSAGRIVEIRGRRFIELEPDLLTADGPTVNWIKWGDQNSVEFVVPPGGVDGLPSPDSLQLLRVDYRMPTTWTLRSIFKVLNPIRDDTGFFTVTVTLSIGVGTASCDVVRTLRIPSTAAGVFPDVVVDEVFPAQKVNAKVGVTCSSATATGGQPSVQATLLIAPRVF